MATDALFTGYYEPMLSCRVNADDVYKYPLYKRPDDIVEIDLTLFGNDFPRNRLIARIAGRKVLPYFSREEIDQNKALYGRNLEMLWCDGTWWISTSSRSKARARRTWAAVMS